MSDLSARRTGKKIQPVKTKGIAQKMAEKPMVISPSQGVPPPVDKKFNEISFDSSLSLSDAEDLAIKSKNDNISTKLKEKLSLYKKSNQEHLKRQSIVIEEAISCREDIELVKESLGEALVETFKSKEQLKEIRNFLETEENKEDIEQVKETEIREENCTKIGFDDEVFEQLKELKNAVDYMKSRLTNTEENLLAKQTENEGLRNVVGKLKESIIEQKIMMGEKATPSCASCSIM